MDSYETVSPLLIASWLEKQVKCCNQSVLSEIQMYSLHYHHDDGMCLIRGLR